MFRHHSPHPRRNGYFRLFFGCFSGFLGSFNSFAEASSLQTEHNKLHYSDSSKRESKYIQYFPVLPFFCILFGFFLTLRGLDCFYDKGKFLGATLYLLGLGFAIYGFFGYWL